MDRDPLSPEEFKTIYSQVPRLCVDAIIRSEKGVLLTLRNLPHWNNMWHFPGATLRYRERPEDAVKRAAKNETGAEITIVKFLGYMEFPSEQKERGFGSSISLAFLCDLVGGKLEPKKDASEIRIFSDLPENMIVEQKEFLMKHWDEIF